MSMKFGLLLPQGFTMNLASIKDPVEAYETLTRVAQTADEVGFESIWLFDHLHTAPSSQEALFECWTTAAALARDTKRIRIGQHVTCNNFRNPALLAKMASTVDVLSHGRLNFGIGAGWYEHEHRAYGYDYPDAPERLRLLHESLQIILSMWTQEEAVFEGKYCRVNGAINQPKGVQKPHIPLMIGGGGEKVTLKLVAQYADACHFVGFPNMIKQKYKVLKEHCETVGRDYESIRRLSSAFTAIAETDEQALASLPVDLADRLKGPGTTGAFGGMFANLARDWEFAQKQMLVGGPDTMRQRLAAFEEAGVQELILIFPDPPQLDRIRLFAKEIIGSVS